MQTRHSAAADLVPRTEGSETEGPWLLAVTPDLIVVAWSEAPLARGAAALHLDGRPVPPPSATIRIERGSRPALRLLAFRAGARSAPAELAILRDDAPTIMALPADPAPADPAPLVAGLDDPARAQLLQFVLGLCRGVFRLGDDVGFAAFCRRLALAAVPSRPIPSLAARGRVLGGLALLHGDAPTRLGPIDGVYFVTGRGVAELKLRPLMTPTAEGAVRLCLLGPAPAMPGTLAVAVTRHGAALWASSAAVPPLTIVELAERRELSTAERNHLLHGLGTLIGAPATALARTLQIMAPEPPRALVDAGKPVNAALELAIGCGKAGVFARGWIRDPHGLVSEAELASPFGTASLSAVWHRAPRAEPSPRQGSSKPAQGSRRDAARLGFVGLVALDEPVPVLQHRLRLRTTGGTIEIVPPLRPLSAAEARDAVLASMPERELSEAVLARAIAPAVSELHRRAMAQQGTPEIVTIGEPRPNPAISAIIPLYRNLSFLRPQIGAFAIDPTFHRMVELIYVLDSPEQRLEVEHLLQGLNALTGLPFRLVVMTANLGYAAANNTGVRVARGRRLMLLNSDVLPLAPGWLATLDAALTADRPARPVGAVGPKLLFDDGSLQHAGLTFARDLAGRWYNTHFFKGYPRDWPAANRPRSVPAVTGAAMLLPRAAYEEVGGFTEDYVVGDFEDSDLCLKLRRRGLDIRYEPRAELHHFERRSITLHPVHARSVASSYNQHLHATRWAGFIEELLAETAEGAAPLTAAPPASADAS